MNIFVRINFNNVRRTCSYLNFYAYPTYSSFRFKPVTMKFLNVAEKNDAAKNIALHLSRGTSRRLEGLSRFNKIYEFEAEVMGQKCKMVMTSVSGHLLALEFVGLYKNWQSCNPLTLFDAQVFKYCPKDYEKIKKTLEREVLGCQGLIIWTDCDREGENIGFEIIDVCTAVKSNLVVYRAKFSEITSASVHRALRNLEQPNKNISDAVDVRQELDLRIGAAFTRLQTLRLQKVFPSNLANNIVSYGSCQFPTLGFVVERYRAIENFVVEPFWKISVNHTMNNLSVQFTWERGRLFDKHACQVLHSIVTENPQAKVVKVSTQPKSKWRPLPLDTVELEKLASRKLKLNAKKTMSLAEKLYTQGFISYPRTETNQFPKEMNLRNLVELHTGDGNWGAFAQRILDEGGPTPRQGKKTDMAHPPIHPTKYTNTLSGDEFRLYEFIVRSFLACCSKDAQGQETTVTINIANEAFSASGLMITARNYLDVYPYDRWSSKEIHLYEMGQLFTPSSIDMVEGATSPPNLLTEADLIALMEKHGIGTDATHAEHIETIKSRSYVALSDNVHFVPGILGMGLVEGYDAMGLNMSKPHLRANLEADLKAISEGRKQPSEVLADQIAKYKEAFITVMEQAHKIDSALALRFNQTPNDYSPSIETLPVSTPSAFKCPKCGADMVVRPKKNSDELYIGCSSFPNCRNAVWLPSVVKKIEVMAETCTMCGPNYHKIKFEWRNNSLSHLYPAPYTACIGGCDITLLEHLSINPSSVKKVPAINSQMTNNTRNASSTSQTGSTRNVTSTDSDSRSGWSSSNVSRQNVSNTAQPRAIAAAHQNAPQLDAPRAQNTVNTRWPTPPAINTAQPRANSPVWQNAPQLNAPRAQNTVNTRWPTPPAINTAQPRANSPAWQNAPRAQNAVNRMPIPAATPSSTSDSDNVIVCKCNQPAVLLTTRKQNENYGRQFYKCPTFRENGGCDFFTWATPPSETTPSNSPSTSNSTWGTSSDRNINQGRDQQGWGVPRNDNPQNNNCVMCNCGRPCKLLTTRKEGPNTGRQFYKCSDCDFFEWADGESSSSSSNWGSGDRGSGASSRGRGARGPRGGARGTRGGASAGSRGGPRLCSLCRQEGHTRTRCPQRQPTRD